MPTRRSATLRLLAAALLLAALPGCGDAGRSERGPTVLAASSLQEALEEAGRAWAGKGRPMPVLAFAARAEAGRAWAGRGRPRPVLSCAASGALARQVEQGAPADLFVSADEAWMDAVEAQDLLREGTRTDLLTNRLVLVRPKGTSTRGLDDLGDGKLALADPPAEIGRASCREEQHKHD